MLQYKRILCLSYNWAETNSQEKEPKSSKTTLCPFIVMHVLLNATKSLLLLQLHWMTYLVNFHPKQSQKSMSAFIPSLHFLGEITVLPQKKPNLCTDIFSFMKTLWMHSFRVLPISSQHGVFRQAVIPVTTSSRNLQEELLPHMYW